MTDNYYQNISKLFVETDNAYAKIVEKLPEGDKLSLTRKKTIESRGWQPSLRLFEKNIERVFNDLKYFYVPRIIAPGPAFVFPIRDVDGGFSCAQTKPLEGSVLFDAKRKYNFIGSEPTSPRWLGNDPETIKRIMKLKAAMCVEGGYDILASRLLCPNLPILSPLTKNLSKKHILYLRMLGVKHLFIMFDNEVDGKDKASEGAGGISMQQHARMIKTMKVTPLECPAEDPSAALQDLSTAAELKSIIEYKFRLI
jgi:hypothetical protein